MTTSSDPEPGDFGEYALAEALNLHRGGGIR